MAVKIAMRFAYIESLKPYTSLTVTPFLSPWKWNKRGVYSSGLTDRKPLSAPPCRYLPRKYMHRDKYACNYTSISQDPTLD